MAKKKDESKIYEREYRLLEKVDEFLRSESAAPDALLEKCAVLAEEYRKLLKNATKITKIGDANQRKLMRMLILEQEKLRLEREVKERTAEIEEKNKRLKELADSKARFFANISHEFRTPLTLIIGPLEQRLSADISKREEKTLTLMMRNAQRLLGLVNQLLELSRYETGGAKLKAAEQDIVPFLKGIVAALELLAGQNDLDMRFEGAEESIMLFFDPEKLEEVFYNLLLNAVKFTPQGGRITVSVSRTQESDSRFPGGALDIVISDTGPGIPSERMQHIFDLFYQVNGSYSGSYKGSGIGLSIVKGLVELHHGTVHVTSRQEERSGTEFVVRLPFGGGHLKPEERCDLTPSGYTGKERPDIRQLYIAEKEEKEHAFNEQEGDGAFPAKGNAVVLVVEDNADVRSYIRRGLEPDYEVVEAVDGLLGMEKAKTIIPDLIISDVMMPGADGFQLCKTLKNNVETSHIPVILLTAKVSEPDVVNGLESGADDYMAKPFNMRMLSARIRNLIALRSQLQQESQRRMTLQPVKPVVSHIDKTFLLKLQTAVNDNLSDPEFNVEALSKTLDMSGATLYRKVHALTGESPTEYIRSSRLKRAAEMLKSSGGSVTEVVFEVGFTSRAYFTKCFKEKFHQLPSTFKDS